MLKRLFALSDKGAADLKKGGVASAFSSLSLFVPMALCLMLCKKYVVLFWVKRLMILTFCSIPFLR